MSLQNWSDNIILVEAQEGPQFAEDMEALLAIIAERTDQDVVIDMSPVEAIGSSDISRLLKLRKQVVVSNGRQLRLCAVTTHVWGVFLMTGLDKVFDFADNLMLGLATIQLGE